MLSRFFSSNSQPSTPSDASHLVILVHGLFSFPFTTQYLEAQIKANMSDVVILKSSSNVFWRTTHGIDVAGKRLAEEITTFKEQHQQLQEISFVGVSLGGLIARYAAGVLYDQETRKIAGLTPHMYASFASPHLGVNNLLSYFVQHYGSKLFAGRSGQQLFLRDTPNLLVDMTKGKFLEALKSFDKRVLYANLKWDHRVPYSTGAIYPFESEEGSEAIPSKETLTPIVEIHEDEPLQGHPVADTLEKEMCVNLRREMGWTRVDCLFDGRLAPMLSHSNIAVVLEVIHFAGKDVIKDFVERLMN